MECKELETNINGEAIASHADGRFLIWKEFFRREIDEFSTEDAYGCSCCHIIPVMMVSRHPAHRHSGSRGIATDAYPRRVMPIFLM